MSIKALAIASALALSAPLAAQAITIDGFDSNDASIVQGAGGGNQLNTDYALMIVKGNTSDVAANLIFDFNLMIDSSMAQIGVTLLPDGDSVPGVKDLVVSTFLNGNALGSYALSDSNGVALPLYDTMQPQLTDLFSPAAASGDVFRIIASYSGFASNRSSFNLSAVVQPVPLPAAALMFLTALGGLGFVSRRRSAA